MTYSQLGVFTGGFSNNGIEVEGFTPTGETDRESAIDVVGPGYFRGLGVPLSLGRDLTDSDRGDSPKVCVINEAFARKFFAGRHPLGMRVTTVDDVTRTPYQVVGVAGNAHTVDARGQVEPRYYVSAEQPPQSPSSPTFIVRTATDSASVMAAIRAGIQEVDAALPIISAKSIQERLAPLTAQDRTTAQLAVVFGVVALVLAAIGLYGVLSYGVARRTGEIAVRIALGAQSRGVIAMILRETLGVVMLGLIAGSALAYLASRLIDSRLFGVAPQDPHHDAGGHRGAAVGGALRRVPAGATRVTSRSDGRATAAMTALQASPASRSNAPACSSVYSAIVRSTVLICAVTVTWTRVGGSFRSWAAENAFRISRWPGRTATSERRPISSPDA